ncbi:MAG TPA: hypothetical protein VMN60_10000 [Longimicrobiales bacterium]|nr:hypothetical protein [Longimicrobiales bacterium]
MSMRTAVIALSPLLTGIPALTLPPANFVNCRDVHGSIEASVERVRPSISGLRFDGAGTSRGDLEGAVSVRAFKRIGASDLRLRLLITTDAGIVEVSGSATTEQEAGAPDVRTIHGTWRVAGQTGSARGAAGAVTGAGSADTRARSARIEYAGRICEENVAVDTNPRIARRSIRKWLAVAV